MKLQLHIGTEKTGSSYIQYILAKNREFLAANSIYYPFGGKREKDMVNARISPGNGKDFYDLLKSSSNNQLAMYLIELLKESKKQKCSSILISNENLLEELSKPSKWNELIKICLSIGIELDKVLLVIRNPLDQAISLYKHRAKRGTQPHISEWIECGYHLDYQLSSFVDLAKQYSEVVSIRKYNKNSNHLLKVVFNDWLKISLPSFVENQSVNPSLTLSELLFLKELNLVNSNLVEPFYNKMLSLSVENKANDTQVENNFKILMANYFYTRSEIWKKVNGFLSLEEQLEIDFESYIKDKPSKLDQRYMFSENQIKEISTFIGYSLSMRFKILIFWNSIKKGLIKVIYFHK